MDTSRKYRLVCQALFWIYIAVAGAVLFSEGRYFLIMLAFGLGGLQYLQSVLRIILFHQLLILVVFEVVRRFFLRIVTGRRMDDYHRLFFSLENRLIADNKSIIINRINVFFLLFVSICIGYLDKSVMSAGFFTSEPEIFTSKIALPLSFSLLLYFGLRGNLRAEFVENKSKFIKGLVFALVILLFYGYLRIFTVYYGEQRVMGADPLTYQNLDSGYSKDKNAVYDYGLKVEGADPAIFISVASGSGFGKDKNVYLAGKVIEGADADTFVVLDGEESGDKVFGKDKNGVYFKERKLDGVDLASFELIDPSVYTPFFKDKNSVYSVTQYGTVIKKLDGVDAASFDALTSFYCKDKNAVYYIDLDNGGLHKIESADVPTFIAIFANYGDDKNVTTTFYAKDKNALYYYGIKVEGADPASFQVGIKNGEMVYDISWGKDNSGYYREGVKIPHLN